MTVFLLILKIIGWVLLSVLALILIVLCIRVGVEVEYSEAQTAVHLRYLFLRFPLYPRAKKEASPQPKAEEPPAEQPPQPAESSPEASQTEPAQEIASEVAQSGPAAQTDAPAAPAEPAQPADEASGQPPQPAAKKKDSFLKMLYDAEGVDGLLTIVKKIFSYTKTFFGNALHGVVVDELWLEVCCTRSDAAATAIYYGEVCGILFPMLGALASRCRVKKYDINVYPDFLARFSHASFFTRFHITPIYFIGIILAYGLKMLCGVLVGILVKLFLPKKEEKKKQEIQIKTKEKSESK